MKYYYDFKDEKIIEEAIDITITFNENTRICNIIKTEENILFFEDITKENILHNTRFVAMPSEYNLILKIPIKDLKKSFENDNTIITYKDKIIILNNYKLD